MIDQFASKKFILALISVVILGAMWFTCIITKQVDISLTRDVIFGIVGIVMAYMGGNSYEHYINKKNENKQS